MKKDLDPRPYHQIYTDASEFIEEVRRGAGVVTQILGDGPIINRALDCYLDKKISLEELEKAFQFEQDVLRIIFFEFSEQEKRDFLSSVGGKMEYGKPVSVTVDEAVELFRIYKENYLRSIIGK